MRAIAQTAPTLGTALAQIATGAKWQQYFRPPKCLEIQICRIYLRSLNFSLLYLTHPTYWAGCALGPIVVFRIHFVSDGLIFPQIFRR